MDSLLDTTAAPAVSRSTLFVAIRHHPDFEGLTLFTASAAPHKHDVHTHDAYSVIVITSGAKLFHNSGCSLRVSANDIAIANPGEPHGCEPIDDAPWSHMTWYLSTALMRDIAGLSVDMPLPRLSSPIIADGALATALNDAHVHCMEGDAIDRQSVTLDALGRLVEGYASFPSGHIGDQATDATASGRRMTEYLRLLEAAVGDQIDLSHLADAVGVHRNQVIRDFRVVHGFTPGVYLRHLRLNKAKALIKQGARLADAAVIAGFSDQSHFTRCFRAAYGVTPSRFETLLSDSAGNAPL